MFTLFERSDEFNQLNAEAIRLARPIVDELSPLGEEKSYSLGESIRVNLEGERSVFYIREGFVAAEGNEGTLYFLEAGQLLGLGIVNRVSLSFVAKSEVNGLLIPLKDAMAVFQKNETLLQNVLDYNQVQSSLLQLFLSRLCPKEVSSLPKIRAFNKGEPIVIQETTPHEVFTMLQGEASAYLQDVRVGSVKQGDIFGAMAASENSGRSASVIADAFCVVSAIPQDEFFALVRTHPRTMHQLVSTMSSIIISQNEELLEKATQ